ncbi:ATP-binding cassette domain-containing protein [Mesomycoplasma neurolyticum]|uniref:ATP-binding cassette domain-containing protein n=1 Tax=Mesomycoplasma neurolyticum TaxID=2120 RepID=UPI0013EE161F|nr:ABC transporter ATP-binding protein [Mesomycoplasma neurolyticum]
MKNKLLFNINKTIVKKSLNFISNQKPNIVNQDKGKYLYWISDRREEIIQQVFSLGMQSLENIFISALSLIIVFILSWKIALISLVFIIINFFISLFLTQKTVKLDTVFFDKHELTNNLWIKNFDNFLLYWQIGLENLFFKSNENNVNKIEKNFKKVKTKVILLEIINSFITIFFNFLIFLLTIFFVLNKIEKIGILFIIPSLLLTIIQALRVFLFSLQRFKTHKKFFKKISSFESIKKCDNSYLNIKEIKIENLNYKIGEKEILKNISLIFEKGKKYAIIGSSGIGKSTLIHLITKQLPTQNSSIYINGINIEKIESCKLNNSFHYIDSNATLFDTNLYNNITLWEKNEHNDVLNALKKASFSISENDLKNNVNNLSSGEKQKINLASFFLKKTNVLILDEAFSQIDNKNLRNIWNEINKIENLLLINITHHINGFENYDEIINLEALNEVNLKK